MTKLNLNLNNLNGQILNLTVCNGRHEMPNSPFPIFENSISSEDLLNPEILEDNALEYLLELFKRLEIQISYARLHSVQHATKGRYSTVEVSYSDYMNGTYSRLLNKEGNELEIKLYATGLTVALIAIVNALKALTCNEVHIMHYDRDNNSYYEQVVR